MKIPTHRLAPLALSLALAFGTVACGAEGADTGADTGDEMTDDDMTDDGDEMTDDDMTDDGDEMTDDEMTDDEG